MVDLDYRERSSATSDNHRKRRGGARVQMRGRVTRQSQGSDVVHRDADPISLVERAANIAVRP